MKKKIWTTFILLTLLVLTACASPSSASPTPTIVRLDSSALETTEVAQVSEEELAEATATPIPTLTSTPTAVAATAPVTATLESAVTATPEPATVQVEIIAAGLNVREGAGINHPVTGTVARGAILNITAVSADGNWLQIVTPEGNPGWISSQPAYIRLIGSLDDLQPAEAASDSQSSTSNGGGVAPQPPAIIAQGSANNSQPALFTGGKLVFNTRNGGDLYVINIDGTGLQKLASGVIDPVVSPDGQQVAFTRWDGAEFGTLYVMNLDGSGERAVLSETRQAKSPTWSPDGQAIIVSFQHGGLRDPDKECRRFEVGEEVRLPENAQIVSSRSIGEKDTIEICFIRREDLQWGLRQVDLATGEFKDLPADLYSFNPIWDPRNPSRIIYDGLRGLMQLDLTSGDLQPFTSDVGDTAPVFSPDGQKLALTYKQHDHWEVYTYELASGARQRLTKPPILANPQYNSAAPAWSSDGSQLAFVTDRSGQWEIWVMNADGSNPQPLFSPELQAQWGLSYEGVNERMLSWIGAPATPAVTSPAASRPAGASAGETASLAGEALSGAWDFTFGSMTLTQRNSRVEGVYQWYGGVDSGQVKGIVLPELNQFQGLWISDRSPNSQGILRWQLAGDNFSGSFDGARSGQWCGVRSGQPLPAGCGFSGVWQLGFGNPPALTGQATLVQTGQTVQGTFVDNQGHTGEIVDGIITMESITEMKLSGTWRNDQGQQDSFEWRLNLTTGQAFEGRRNPGNSEWCGWREDASAPEQCGW